MKGIPLDRLKRHPVPIAAHFQFVFVLTYAFPAEVLEPLLPPGLELDRSGDKGFVAVACVQTKSLRPKGWPEFVGQDFFLIGYRIFARYKTTAGQNLRGLRILRSEADRPMMVLGGNLLTHYNYHLAKIDHSFSNGELKLSVKSQDGLGDLNLRALCKPELAQEGNASTIGPTNSETGLPSGSIFASVREALMFAGPLPFTFDYEKSTHSIIRIEGVRQDWHPKPVSAEVNQLSFFRQEPFAAVTPILCSAFYLENLPYYWKRGICEPLSTEKTTDKNAQGEK